ncbi:MAG: hypothetical protein ACRDJH_12600 [Thermomicrobiales bacterium]
MNSVLPHAALRPSISRPAMRTLLASLIETQPTKAPALPSAGSYTSKRAP